MLGFLCFIGAYQILAKVAYEIYLSGKAHEVFEDRYNDLDVPYQSEADVKRELRQSGNIFSLF